MKTINVEVFEADGTINITMKLTLKKPIEAETFQERQVKIRQILDRDPCCVENDYVATWNWKGNKEGFMRKHSPAAVSERQGKDEG